MADFSFYKVSEVTILTDVPQVTLKPKCVDMVSIDFVKTDIPQRIPYRFTAAASVITGYDVILRWQPTVDEIKTLFSVWTGHRNINEMTVIYKDMQGKTFDFRCQFGNITDFPSYSVDTSADEVPPKEVHFRFTNFYHV